MARRPFFGAINRIAVMLIAAFVFPALAHAQTKGQTRSGNQPVPPFHIIGSIYYVGASDVTSFLIVTPAGDILIDGGYPETASQIESNMEKLGFKVTEIKLLLNSHAHIDHAGGLAQLQKDSGAELVAMSGDAGVLARGGHDDFFFGDRLTFPAAIPDRVIRDGEEVSLGGVTLVAHLTPGHTRGCTTWTMITEDDGKPYHVVFVGSATVLPGYRLTQDPSYPGIAADYEKTIEVLKSLPCDVFLGSHGSFFDLSAKREALEKGASPNPFIDPAGYRAYVASAEKAIDAELKKESASSPAMPAAPDADREAAVMKVEREWLDALQHNNSKALERILAAEWVDNTAVGSIVTRESFFSRKAPDSAAGLAMSEGLENTRVRFYGDVAIATGSVEKIATEARTGKTHTQRTIFTDVFVWRDSRWQAISSQETFVPEGAQ